MTQMEPINQPEENIMSETIIHIDIDLIGEHGFTQDHYDTLTGPWRKTIGQLHADDEALL